MNKNNFIRPALDEALEAWKQCLAGHGLPTDCLWIFSENLCVERAPAVPGGFRVGFQTKFSPPDDDALEIAYDQFCETASPIVFYRLGTAAEKSICILLCDPWFEKRAARDGFERREEWKISFRPGHAGNIEEITDLTRWVRRVKHNRAFHDFDFGMELATIDAIKIHGTSVAALRTHGADDAESPATDVWAELNPQRTEGNGEKPTGANRENGGNGAIPVCARENFHKHRGFSPGVGRQTESGFNGFPVA